VAAPVANGPLLKRIARQVTGNRVTLPMAFPTPLAPSKARSPALPPVLAASPARALSATYSGEVVPPPAATAALPYNAAPGWVAPAVPAGAPLIGRDVTAEARLADVAGLSEGSMPGLAEAAARRAAVVARTPRARPAEPATTASTTPAARAPRARPAGGPAKGGISPESGHAAKTHAAAVAKREPIIVENYPYSMSAFEFARQGQEYLRKKRRAVLTPIFPSARSK